MAEHNIFQLIFKSRFSISKETITHVHKELSDEIKYLSTNVVPRARGRELKSALKSIEMLRERRDALDKKYEEWEKAYDQNRMPRSQREIAPQPELAPKSSAVEVTDTEEKTYGLDNTRQDMTNYESTHKSISPGKRFMLKSLYKQAWGTTLGLDDNAISKMSDSEVDAAIKSLQGIFIQ